MPERPSRIRIARASTEAPIGLSTLTVDLGTFLATAREIGFDPGLLLLTMRALALRSGGAVPLQEVGWVLGAQTPEILRWLVALEGSGLCVWQAHGATVSLEIASTETERTLFGPDDAPGVLHRIPTHWFVRMLPLVGRRAFLTYLYLRSRERLAGLTAPLTIGMIARSSGQSPREAERSLRVLQRRGLSASAGGHGRFILTDPPPLSAVERTYLRWLASGAIPPTRAGRVRLLLWFVLPLALVAGVALTLWTNLL
jgi:hypothetical protein